jgi:hypothetical protein
MGHAGRRRLVSVRTFGVGVSPGQASAGDFAGQWMSDESLSAS